MMEDADFVADSDDEVRSVDDAAMLSPIERAAVFAAASVHPAVALDATRSGQQEWQQHQPRVGALKSSEHDATPAQQDVAKHMESSDKDKRFHDPAGQLRGTVVLDEGGGGEWQDSRQERHQDDAESLHGDRVADVPELETPTKDGAASTSSHEEADASIDVENNADAADSGQSRVFQVGDLVEVESRTWPGINKLGGSGRIVSVHRETNGKGEEKFFYDVRYVLGGFERRIESDYVELSHILQLQRAQARVRYERVFYHDEFADELHKKKKPAFEKGDDLESSKPRGASPNDEQKSKSKKKSSRRRSSDSETRRSKVADDKNSTRTFDDDSGDGSSSDDDEDGMQAIRWIGDGTFLMDSLPPSPDVEAEFSPPTRPVQGREQVERERIQEEVDHPERNRRRRIRVIESDEESFDGSNSYAESVENESRKDHRRAERTRVRARKRRRYVGGYLHGGDDADSAFIQPEDNPNALPDDVVREIGFKLGKSKAELKAQLATIASLLKENLHEFKDQKELIDQKIKRASALSLEELTKFYRQTSDMEGFLTQNLIRGGEDLVNAIIVKLTRKGGNLPDSVELVFDDQKREISEHGVWIRKVLSALETAYKVRGESLPAFDDRKQPDRVEPTSDFDQPQDDYDDYDADDSDEVQDDSYYHSPKKSSKQTQEYREKPSEHDTRRVSATEFLVATSKKRSRHKSTEKMDAFLEKNSSFSSGKHTSRDGFFPMAKGKYTTSSSLGDFDFVQYGSTKQQRDSFFHSQPPVHDVFQTTNFRFTAKKRPMAPSDPRWNWLKIGSQKQQQARAKSTTQPKSRISVASGGHGPVQRKRQEQLIGSVQNARFQLRDKRFQDPRRGPMSAGGAFTRSYGCEPSLATTQFDGRSTTRDQSVFFEKPRKGIQGGPVNLSAYEPGSSHFLVKHHGASETPISTPSGPRIDWDSVFEVLSGGMKSLDDGFPTISPEKRETLTSLGTCASIHDTVDVVGEAFEDSVTLLAAGLRQHLNQLRLQEFDSMTALSGRDPENASSESASYRESPEWTALVETCNRYHYLLTRFTSYVTDELHESAAAMSSLTMANAVRVIVVEIACILSQLPDCDSLFGSCPSYVYFFEVADRDAKTTPLLTSLARTYWHCIQSLLGLKKINDANTIDNKSLDATIERILPVSRAILAASLFLVDLYLYLPSLYRLDQVPDPSGDENGQNEQRDTDETAIPAISLWLLLYNCFASGKCAFQAGKLSGSGDGRDFWAFLQTMYRDHFIDHLAIAFVQEKSCGGYLFDHIPQISSREHEETAQGQLLAVQSVWDLCLLFATIFPSTSTKERDDAISEARWAVVKDLLQPGMHAFLPFESSALTTHPQSGGSDYPVYSSVYKNHVLQYVFLISKLSVPQSDIIERLLEEFWGDTKARFSAEHDRNTDAIELTPFWHQLLQHAIHSNDLSAFVSTQTWDSANSTEMISGILLVHILKFDKAIHRNRFRQPICRAIAARYDATTQAADSSASQSSNPKVGVEKAPATKANGWNWGTPGASDANKSVNNGNQKPTTTAQNPAITRGRDEERLMVSILLTLAVSSICQDAGPLSPSPSTLRDTNQRANKSLKRDLEFYYKEIARILNGNPEHSVLLSQSLFVMGRLAIEYSNEYPILFSYLNAQLVSGVQALRAHRSSLVDKEVSVAASPVMKKRTRLLEPIVDPAPSSTSSYALDAVRTSLSFILNSGLEACLDAAVDEILPFDALNVALEILHFALPRAKDIPNQHLHVMMTPVDPSSGNASGASEFDEFDDDDMWAAVDLDTLTAPSASASSQAKTVKYASLESFQDAVEVSTLSHLRLVMQRVVIKFPPRSGLASYQEQYAIEVLGMLVATCSFPFSWNVVSGSSMKPRVLAPRLFGAILKYHPEKEWISTCFLSEQGADQELANMWLMGTLDLQALFPSLCTLQPDASIETLTLENEQANKDQNATDIGSPSQVQYSNYWVMLTDGIIFHLLRGNPITQYKMDPLLLQLLRGTARNTKFASILRHATNSSGEDNVVAPPSDLATLYELHLDLFQEFCRSSGQLWSTLAVNPTQYRADQNRFRVKMMDIKSGVFATFPEAYEINFKMVCKELDHAHHNWYELAENFVADFASAASSFSSSSSSANITNFHTIDESLALILRGGQRRAIQDATVRKLIVLFKFMYDCADPFLYHCGSMAIGQQNIFFAVLKLMFRQATCAEFPQAEDRLRQQQLHVDSQEARWFFDFTASSGNDAKSSSITSGNNVLQPRNKNATKADISPACLGFVESVRLFFARQKYPSLIHWFAQTLETYQTVKRGWHSSPLRKLLLNVLDPHGPLGIHSYYPIEMGGRQQQPQREFDVRQVRREAFYLSCGLFFCRCTTTYEHSRRCAGSGASSNGTTHAPPPSEAHARLRTLRRFILKQFVIESFEYAASVGHVCLQETMVPLAQFARSVLSHSNMNVVHNASRPDFDFQVQEVYTCLELLVMYCIRTFPSDHVLQNSISCVLVLELCGLLEETVVMNNHSFDSEISTLLELGLAYLKEVHVALGKTTSRPLEPLFVSQPAPPTLNELLASFTPIASHGIKVEPTVKSEGSASRDEYGISRVRVKADLVVSLGRLSETWKQSSDLRLRRFVPSL
ncbi:hypothetical protein FI667_g1309, partial [Globisporangium splendens]